MIYDYLMNDMDIELIEAEISNAMENIVHILYDKNYHVADYNEGSFNLSIKLDDIYSKNLSFDYNVPYIRLSPNIKPIDLEIPNFLFNNWKIIYRYSKSHYIFDEYVYASDIIDDLDVDFMIIRFNDDKYSIFKDFINDLDNKEIISTKIHEYYKKFLEAEYKLLDWVKTLERRKP